MAGSAPAFIAHQQRFNGARSERSALERYTALWLQGTRPGADGHWPVGHWQELVAHPLCAMLCGDSGTGKTTLLLREVMEMAANAHDIATAPLPIYLPLGSFQGGDADGLLEAAAAFNAIPSGT